MGPSHVKHITIDKDPTDDPTHGGQQLSFFNGALRHVVLFADGGLCHLQSRTGAISILLRATSGQCAGEARSDWDLGADARARARILPEGARSGAPRRGTRRTGHAGLSRAERSRLHHGSRRTLHVRGEIENRIKELHHGLEIDRTSCTSFLANQVRVLLTAAAYALMQDASAPAAASALVPRSALCANGCSSSVSGWSARCGLSCCICQWRSPTAVNGRASLASSTPRRPSQR
jgi:hypothetical protein